MSQNSFTISYPALHSGTDKSLINFISGRPDLAALFFEGEEAKETRRRFFVTDATVASLECMQSFISKFDDFENKLYETINLDHKDWLVRIRTGSWEKEDEAELKDLLEKMTKDSKSE